jgi:hypothetical protein
MAPMVIVFVVAFKKWYEVSNIRTTVVDKWGERVRADIPGEDLTLVEAEMLKARAIPEPAKIS